MTNQVYKYISTSLISLTVFALSSGTMYTLLLTSLSAASSTLSNPSPAALWLAHPRLGFEEVAVRRSLTLQGRPRPVLRADDAR